MSKIVLASQSPRRKQLLSQLGLPFQVVPSLVNEEADIVAPVALVEELAERKAREVSTRFPNDLVIGADTIVAFGSEILGKPESFNHAVELLNKLSGNWHEVYTGVALRIQQNEEHQVQSRVFHQVTRVKFSELSPAEIDHYVRSGSPMDKAGAYGIQDDWGAVFVERIEGDYYNVVGFPLHRFYQELKTFAPHYLELKKMELDV